MRRDHASTPATPGRATHRVLFVASPPPSSAEAGLDALVDLLTTLWADEALRGVAGKALTPEKAVGEDSGESGAAERWRATTAPNPQT